jgi:dTDP-4-dehydrorhamnose reductase
MLIDNKVKVLVLGVSGMLGSSIMRFLSESPGLIVFGSIRSAEVLNSFNSDLRKNIIMGVDVESDSSLRGFLSDISPDVVINCIGLIKQLSSGNDPLSAISINSLLPHRLAKICAENQIRVIQMGTDCVFSGRLGLYKESDIPDAIDLYGRTKYLGELNYPNTITLRTSIIGHELAGSHSLIGWFLSQQNSVYGFKKMIFSGLPTVEMARIIRDFVIPFPQLSGLYHVSANPISKYDLLHLVASEYEKNISILPDDKIIINRSLDSSRFQKATGYRPPEWNSLIKLMHKFQTES